MTKKVVLPKSCGEGAEGGGHKEGGRLIGCCFFYRKETKIAEGGRKEGGSP